MKHWTKYVVLALLLIAVAGIAWGSKPAADPAPATETETVESVEVMTPDVDPCVLQCQVDYRYCKRYTCDFLPSCIEAICAPNFLACTDNC